MNLPLISVVVPFVNHRSYIDSCWRNMRLQSYENIELLFINNGSSDGSDILAEKLTIEFPEKIKLFNESQKGIPFARNRGLKEAKGEYISFLDIDDNFTPGKLEKLYHLLLKYPEAAMAYGQTLRIYTDADKKIIQDTGIAKQGLNQPPDLALDWTKSLFRLPQTGATLTRTETARAIKGFPENLLLGNDDVGYHVHIALKYPVVFDPFIAVEYYRHEKSEGARLNQSVSVHSRYFDAYSKSVFVLGQNYFEETGDIRLFGIAQRAVFNNYLYIRYKYDSTTSNLQFPPKMFRLYVFLKNLYQYFPYPIAHFIRKVFLKIACFVNPDKYGR